MNRETATTPAGQSPAWAYSVSVPRRAGSMASGLLLLLVWLQTVPAAAQSVPGPPQLVRVDPPAGVVSQLRRITFTFNEAVTEVAHNDLVINALGAHNLPTVSNNVVVFDFPLPPYGPLQVQVRNIRDLAQNQNMTAQNFTYTHVDLEVPAITNLFPAAGATVRGLGQVEVFFNEPVQGADPADLTLNGLPATNLMVKPGGALTFQFAPPPPGAVELAWAGGHGITDHASTPNPFTAPAPVHYTLDPARTCGDVIITELCAANHNGLTDEDGLAVDWIELHNRDRSPVDLAGWSLSDDPLEPGKWVFPTCLLAPDERLVVLASGKNRPAPTGTNRFHLNFTLSAGGEPLGLYTPDSPRELRQGFDPAFPAQRIDFSWGLEAAGQWRYFATPTPGAPNPASALTNTCEAVHFGVERGFFNQAFDLVLTTITPGATIRYTTNGFAPTATTGFVYSRPLRMAATTLLRAAAFHPERAPSIVRTHTYLFHSSAAIRSLPVLSIVTGSNTFAGPNGITAMSVPNFVNQVWTPLTTNDYNNYLQHGIAWERPVSAELIRPVDNGGFQIDCGIRVQGSGFMRPRYGGPLAAGAKVSYRLYFRGDYGEGRLRYPLFPTSSVTDFDVIVLRAGHNDQSNPFIKDELARRLHADMGHGASAGTFVNLFINGAYQGYYNPCERVNDDSFEQWEGAASGWDHVAQGSELRAGDRAAWDQLLDRFTSGSDMTQPANYQAVAARLDLTSFLDYLLVCFYTGIGDWPQNNWATARPRTPGGLFQYYGWDFESGFGNNASVNMFTGDLNGPSEIAISYRGLYASTEFRQLWADRVQHHFFNDGALVDDNASNHFNLMRAELAGVIPAMDQSILTTWLPARRAALFSQFAGLGLLGTNAPVLSQHGGRIGPGFELSMTAPLGGTLYYTLDGSDPRVPFTAAVAAGALTYTAPVPLTASGIVAARSLNGGTWSPLVTAQFQYASLGAPIRITELNYHPPGGSAYEFVELRHVGEAPLDVSNFSFDGLTFSFPVGTVLMPGAYVVLVNNDNPAAFAARYPDVTVFGHFAGNLANGGERIALRDAAGRTVTAVNFDDDNGWPLAADGFGPSLELVASHLDPNAPANWRASAAPYGTPGAPAGSGGPPTVQVVFSEIMAHNLSVVNHEGTFPDWIELGNPLAIPQDLAGCSFTDDGNPRKFVFPPGTILPANGRLVVWCDTNATAGLHAGFALDRGGENLFLFDAQTNLVASAAFGPQLNDHSMAMTNGDWRLATPTPGAPNVLVTMASPANLVVNEWLANPAPGRPDWLELHNRSTTAPVALQGLYLGTSNDVFRLNTPMFIPPGGHLTLYANEGSEPDSLPFRLPATGGAIVLYDALANELDRVTYSAQAESVSRGRLPDGALNLTSFPGTASPGAANYVLFWNGPVWNEVLARNVTAVTVGTNTPDFLEMLNPAPTHFPLAGLSVSVDRIQAGQWTFPPGSVIAPGEHLVLWCDNTRPASTNAGDFNTGRAIDGDSGGAYLFNAAGQLVDWIELGPQVVDQSIGRSGGPWQLLTTPTPGAANAAAQPLGLPTALRFNEWLAASTNGPDWFELFNTTNLPVELSGLYLTDDPSTAGLTQFRIPPLSFIGATQWVVFVADNDPEQGRHHVNFNLDAEGEGLVLVQTNGATATVLDAAVFALQAGEVSMGRIPDGSPIAVAFPGSVTRGAANVVVGPPQIPVPPADVLTNANATVVFAAFAAGSLPLAYQWFYNGVALPGETNATLTRTNVQVADDGWYEVRVGNALGTTSAGASLGVLVAPLFAVHPASQTVAPGEWVTLSTLITGNPPPFYFEWRQGTVPQWTNAVPTRSDFYTFQAATNPGNYLYRVIVRNAALPFGRASTYATVTVSADADGDGLPDAWETAHGLPADHPAHGWLDSDGDGVPDGDEYIAGTHPTNALSYLKVDSLTPGTSTGLTFLAQPNKTYTVLWKATVDAAAWNRLEDIVAGTAARVVTLTDPQPRSASRLYRLVTPRWPAP